MTTGASIDPVAPAALNKMNSEIDEIQVVLTGSFTKFGYKFEIKCHFL